MKGDFSRLTFQKSNHYSSVRMQQGRVQLDADWNEQIEIQAHYDRTTTQDTIGYTGGPIHGAGFDIDITSLTTTTSANVPPDFELTPGRYYVKGILCENEARIHLTDQSDLPGIGTTQDTALLSDLRTDITAPSLTYLVYLDVWQRHITMLEHPELQEVALDGVDTTTRTRTIWQVKLARVDDSVTCGTFSNTEWIPANAVSTGQLRAQSVSPTEVTDELCMIPAGGGYTRLENQLYRVETHLSTHDTGGPTFKWSRDNSSLVATLEHIDGSLITVSDPGKDKVLGFVGPGWVELTDEEHILQGRPGYLLELASVQGNTLNVRNWPDSTALTMADFGTKPMVRRWDGTFSLPVRTADVMGITFGTQELEGGIQVDLDIEAVYRTGDYWLIPARSRISDVLWQDVSGNAGFERRHSGAEHYYAPLALLKFDGSSWKHHDCRKLFSPLTQMIRFFHIAGDGQEAMPGQTVPRPLQVGVVNGQQPIAGAQVQFRVVGGSGQLRTAGESSCSDFTTGGASDIMVETEADGIASCCWRLDAATLNQQVEVKLIEIDGNPLADAGAPLLTPIRFNANLSVASQVAYDPKNCPNLNGAETVQAAIDILCRQSQGSACCVTVGREGEYSSLDEALSTLRAQGQRDICICLLPGDHVFPGLEWSIPIEETGKAEFNLKISGCGSGSRILLEKPLRLIRLSSFRLQDVAIELRSPTKNPNGEISLDLCSKVVLIGCHITGFTVSDDGLPLGALVSITNSDSIWIKDNVFEAALTNSLELIRDFFTEAGIDALTRLFSLPNQNVFDFQEFKSLALGSARQLSELAQNERQQLQAILSTLLVDRFQELNRFTDGEVLNLRKLILELGVEQPDLEDLYDTLLDIRRAAIKARPGVVLILGGELPTTTTPLADKDIELVAIDEDDYVTVESNVITGVLSLYGSPPAADFIQEAFNPTILRRLKELVKSGDVFLRGGRGSSGTLQLRGNQLVRITIAEHILEYLLKRLEGAQENQLFAWFDRYLISDNIIESGNNWSVCDHQLMNGNDFTMKATLFRNDIGFVVASSAIYIGNHSGDVAWALHDSSRSSSQAANLDITIA